MSRILCNLSSLYFTCEHIPAKLKLHAGQSYHPFFDASYKQLEQLTLEYQDGNLSETENYLLYLSLFNTTGLVEFRTPAVQTSLTQSIIAQNILQLATIVDKIVTASTERARHTFLMPTYIIGSDTKDLSNTQYWIQNWHACYTEYQAGYKSSTLLQQLTNKESTLEVLIKDRSKDISSYAAQLASWAALAGNFRAIDCIVADGENNDRPIQLAEYWKRIIRTCCTRTNIYSIHDADLDELIEYLEDTVAVIGNIQSHTLMSILRASQKTKINYFNLGDIDIGEKGTIYKILDADSSAEDANKIVLIDSAPQREPILSEYPSKLHYLRARTKWDMAQRYKASDTLRAEAEAELNQLTGTNSTDTGGV